MKWYISLLKDHLVEIVRTKVEKSQFHLLKKVLSQLIASLSDGGAVPSYDLTYSEYINVA